uniref:Transmembrane protein 147 n=1 Tax=Corethron hystrix TaxID=216773 RepID=A0A7S1BGV6_9STRA
MPNIFAILLLISSLARLSSSFPSSSSLKCRQYDTIVPNGFSVSSGCRRFPFFSISKVSSCRARKKRSDSADDRDDDDNLLPMPERKMQNRTPTPSQREQEPTIPVIDDTFLLAGDVLVLFVSGLAVALSNVVSDPSFAASGGWTQPIPLIPLSLGSTINKVSVMGLAWIVAAIKSNAYSASATSEFNIALKCVVSVWVDYCSIQVIITLGVAFLNHASADGENLLLQLVYTFTFMSFWRVLYVRL